MVHTKIQSHMREKTHIYSAYNTLDNQKGERKAHVQIQTQYAFSHTCSAHRCEHTQTPTASAINQRASYNLLYVGDERKSENNLIIDHL